MRDLNRVYRDAPGAVGGRLRRRRGFYWLEPNDADRQRRRLLPRAAEDAERDVVAVVCNFSPVPREGYRSACRGRAAGVEALNTDADVLRRLATSATSAASTAEDTGWDGQPFSAELTLPPLGVMWLVPER